MKTFVTKGLTLSLASLMIVASTGVLRAADATPAAACKDQKSCATAPNEAPSVFKATDILLVRPAAAGLTLVGGALFLVSWPVTAASGDSDESFNYLVRKPGRIAFHRKEGRNETLPSGTKVLKSPRNQ